MDQTETTQLKMAAVALCTFTKTGQEHAVQNWYTCDTCWPGQPKSGCCECCVSTCHAGHAVKFARCAPFFCDCGAGEGPSPCSKLRLVGKPPAPGPAPKLKFTQPDEKSLTVTELKKPKLKPTETKVTTLLDVIRKNRESGGTGHSPDEDPTEYFDEPEELREKAKHVANLIKKSKYVVAYTGAGISTGPGADLPDYRGTEGCWTLRDQGKKPKKYLDIEVAKPTFGHMALYTLYKHGIIKYVVSTNVDGLHLRSGLPQQNLSELHGNGYLERCSGCKKEYLRDFDVQKTATQHFSTHLTGRNCEACGSSLLDSIVNFGENLPAKDLKDAETHSRLADLALVLGTSMRVSPANQLPMDSVQHGGKLVICNLQKTPFDEKAESLVRGYTDDFFAIVLKELGIECEQVTPSGLETIPYVDRVDEIYPKMIERAKKQYDDWKNPPKKAPVSIPSTFSPVVRPKLQIANKTSQTINVESNPHHLIFIKSCHDCTIDIAQPSTKIIIDDCRNTKIRFTGSIITNILELVRCESVFLDVKTPIYTIQIDQSKGLVFDFASHLLLKNLVSNQVSDLVVRCPPSFDHKAVFEYLPNSTAEELFLAQFITHFVGDELMTEPLIRQGEGSLLTTARELKKIEEDNVKAEAMIEAFVRSCIRLEGQGRLTGPEDK